MCSDLCQRAAATLAGSLDSVSPAVDWGPVGHHVVVATVVANRAVVVRRVGCRRLLLDRLGSDPLVDALGQVEQEARDELSTLCLVAVVGREDDEEPFVILVVPPDADDVELAGGLLDERPVCVRHLEVSSHGHAQLIAVLTREGLEERLDYVHESQRREARVQHLLQRCRFRIFQGTTSHGWMERFNSTTFNY